MREETTPPPSPTLSSRPPARKRSGRRPLLIAAAAIGASLALMGAVRYAVPIEATPHRVEIAEFTTRLKGPGTLEALTKTVLGAATQGRLEAVRFDVGDQVAADETVAQLEAYDVEIEIDAALAQVHATAHKLVEATAQRRREEVVLRRAARELARQKALVAKGVAPQAAFDEAQADHEAAAARVCEAAARAARLKAEMLVAHHTVERWRETLAQTVIVAPFDGLVTDRRHEVGDVVAPGAAILEVVDPSSLVLRARFDESLLGRIEPGQVAKASFDSTPDRSVDATVLRINRQVDPETREITVDLTLAALPKNWALGQRGAAEIEVLTSPSALSAPTRFVKRRNARLGVWVLDGRRAAWRPLAVGEASGGRVEILSGLEAGETILDAERLHPGALVETRR